MNFKIAHKQIRAILLSKWDPINIGENANLQDEYIEYELQIAKIMLEKNVDVKTFSDYLNKVSQEDPALEASNDVIQRTSIELFNLYKKIDIT